MNYNKVLSLKNLSKTFGNVKANENVSLDLHRGEILALLGENGAGKTTLMNMLFGHYMPDSGNIEVADDAGYFSDLVLGHPQAAIAAGIGMVHQHFTLAENLDAVDNIMLGAEPLTRMRRNRHEAEKKINALMENSGLSTPLNVPAGRLTVGERQRVEILKALYRNVRILVLDEPTAVLTPQEADTLFENIAAMAAEGLAVIFISHKLREVLAFSHRIAVLRLGKNVGEMATSEADEQKIARMMVGSETSLPIRQAATAGAPVLQLEALSVIGRGRRDSLKSVNLTVLGGEILGIAGVSGNGQAALAGVLSGMMMPEAGKIILNNEEVSQIDPAQMIAKGVGRIPEDRHRDGIIGSMSVAENMIIEGVDGHRFQKSGLLKRENITEHAKALSVEYDVRGPGITAPAQLLSGGNIQKLILARVFDKKPLLILANQPTRGLDMGAAAEVARRLIEARSRGAGVILISEDLDEILRLADRILVIHDGEFAETHTHDRAELGLLMAGQAA